MTERQNSKDTTLWLDAESGMSGIRKRKVDEKDGTFDSDSFLPGTPESVKYSPRKDRSTNGGIFKKLLKFCAVLLLFFVFLCVVLTGVYMFVPSPIDPQSFELPEPPEFSGPLEPNDILTKAELFMQGEVLGAESILLDQDKIYSGTHDGMIVQIDKRKIERTLKLGQEPCDGSFDSEPSCGRPLGIRMNEKNELVVADAYLGLFLVNIWQGTKERLVEGGTVVQGRPLRFINDVVIAPSGDILFTDSSSQWDRRHYLNIFLEEKPDGRLLSYSPSTKAIHVLVDRLYFANGIELTLDKTAVLIAETTMSRIHKYYLEGEKRGKIEVFAQNLPGFPDNIRASSDGNYWVPMAAIRRKGSFSFLDYTKDKPWIRKFVTQLIPARHMNYLHSLFVPSYGLIVQLNQNGEIVKSLHDPTGKTIPGVSEVADAGNVLFLGSYNNPFIGKVQL